MRLWLIGAAKEVKEWIQSLLSAVSSLPSPSIALGCAKLLAFGALGDVSGVQQLQESLQKQVTEISGSTKFIRIQARTALAAASVRAYSLCGMSEQWRSLLTRMLSEDEVSAYRHNVFHSLCFFDCVSSCRGIARFPCLIRRSLYVVAEQFVHTTE